MYQFGNIDVKKVLVIRVLSVLGRREAGAPRKIRLPGELLINSVKVDKPKMLVRLEPKGT